MRIRWKQIDTDRYDVYINDNFVGYVERGHNYKWMCHPEFNFLSTDNEIFYLSYDDGITAGREMSKAWENWTDNQEYLDDEMFGFIDDYSFMD